MSGSIFVALPPPKTKTTEMVVFVFVGTWSEEPLRRRRGVFVWLYGCLAFAAIPRWGKQNDNQGETLYTNDMWTIHLIRVIL